MKITSTNDDNISKFDATGKSIFTHSSEIAENSLLGESNTHRRTRRDKRRVCLDKNSTIYSGMALKPGACVNPEISKSAGRFLMVGGNWHASAHFYSGSDPTMAALEREHEEVTKVKNIERIYMGKW